MTTRYEDLPEAERKRQSERHSKRGLNIPNGSQVVPTEWAYQNGVSRRNNNNVYTKVRNVRNVEHILVLKNDNKQPTTYWAGFWKLFLRTECQHNKNKGS